VLHLFKSLLVDYFELFYHIDGNGAHVTTNQGHAALLIPRYEKGTASTETVTIVLTGHSIAAINCTKNIAGQFSGWLI